MFELRRRGIEILRQWVCNQDYHYFIEAYLHKRDRCIAMILLRRLGDHCPGYIYAIMSGEFRCLVRGDDIWLYINLSGDEAYATSINIRSNEVSTILSYYHNSILDEMVTWSIKEPGIKFILCTPYGRSHWKKCYWINYLKNTYTLNRSIIKYSVKAPSQNLVLVMMKIGSPLYLGSFTNILAALNELKSYLRLIEIDDDGLREYFIRGF